MTRFISLLVSIPIIILVAAFAYKNAQLVSIDLFVLKVDLPISIVMLVLLLIGFILGVLFNAVLLIQQQRKYLRLKHKKDTLQGLSGVLSKSDK